MTHHTTPHAADPSRAQLLAYILAVFAAFVIALASVGAAHAATIDGLTTELRQASVPYDPPFENEDDLSNQPLPSDDNPENT
jgi:cytochrome oxidase Cu insertion factor (SCO1/SenC/PrrC family)